MDPEKAHNADLYNGDVTPPSINSEPDAEDYGVNEKSFLRKIDRKVVPGVTLLYLLSFLDRSNVANAKLDGLTADLNMTGNQYLTGLTLFFVGYISLEVVWNVILKRVGPKIWLPTLTLVWGIVTTLQGVTQNLAGFFVVRTVLGVCEGGLFPGVVFYLSMVSMLTRQISRDIPAHSLSGTSEANDNTVLLSSSAQHPLLGPSVVFWHMESASWTASPDTEAGDGYSLS